MTAQHHSTSGELDLVSMYLNPPVSRAHGMALQLGPEKGGSRKGLLMLDPNHCGLDGWGDRTGCTKMAVHSMAVETTRMRTLDETGRRRVLHHISSPELHDERIYLIEYPAAGLWYLVDERENDEPRIVPLFAAKLFRATPAAEESTPEA